MKRFLPFTWVVVFLALLGTTNLKAQTALPYEIDFGESQEGWTTIDNSTVPGKTWKPGQAYIAGSYVACVTTEPDYGSAADDYFVSPAFSLKANTTYTVESVALKLGPMLSIMIGTSPTDASTFRKIADVQADDDYYFDGTPESNTFTVESDGTYYIAFHGTSQLYGSPNVGYLFGFSLSGGEEVPEPEPEPEPEEPQTVLPYEIDFGESQEGWTTIDNSTVPGKTWKPGQAYIAGSDVPCVMVEPDYSGGAADDYFVSPAFSLKSNTTYTVGSIALRKSSTLSIMIGTSPTDASTFRKIADVQADDDYYFTFVPQQDEFTVESDGTYYMAFYVKGQEYNPSSTGYLFGFSLSGDEETPGPGPEPDPDTELPYAIDFASSTAGWTAADNNQDESTWTDGSVLGYHIYMNGIADDDYISPAFGLVGGKSYKIVTRIALPMGNYNNELSLAGGYSKESLSVIAPLTLPVGGEKEEETVFTATVSGDYYFAFRNTSDEYGSMIDLLAFSIVEIEDVPEDPDQPVISVDFTEDASMEGWTVLDANNDHVTWEVVQGVKGVTYDSENAAGAADDWLVTPAFSVKEGQDYLVHYTLAQSGAFDADDIEVRCGDAATSEALSMLLAAESVSFANGAGTASKVCRLANAQAGEVYVGFRIVTPDWNGKLSLLKVEIVPAEKPVPSVAEDFSASSDYVAKSVTLEWTNPAYDTEQIAINIPMQANIYENGNCVATLDNMVAGTHGTYTYYPSNFSGYVTYGVAIVIGEKMSQLVTTTINLEDIQGELVLVRSFGDVNRTNSADWKIEGVAGEGIWKYNYDNVFTFAYKMGSRVEDDWLISPAVEFETGKRYVVKYELQTNQAYGADIDVTIGTEQNSASQTTVLNSYENLLANGFNQFETGQFLVESSGNHYIGFHVTSASNNVNMRNLEIYYVGEAGPSDIDESGIQDKFRFVQETSVLAVPQGIVSLSVYDMQGRIVRTAYTTENHMDLSGLQKGFYCVRAVDVQGQVVCLKFLR